MTESWALGIPSNSCLYSFTALLPLSQGQANATRQLGTAAHLAAMYRTFDTNEGFHSRHYKLLVYIGYRSTVIAERYTYAPSMWPKYL